MPARLLPFDANQYSGAGSWEDRTGRQGTFTTEFKIADEANHTVAQITRRSFLQEDGTLIYEEHSEVRFTPLEANFIQVTITATGKEYVGQGYVWRNRCHYDIDIDEDVHVENTYTFVDGSIELIGSSTNKGNFTIWGEVLTADRPAG